MALKLSFHFLEKHVKDWLPVDGKSALITGCDTGKTVTRSYSQEIYNEYVETGITIAVSQKDDRSRCDTDNNFGQNLKTFIIIGKVIIKIT